MSTTAPEAHREDILIKHALASKHQSWLTLIANLYLTFKSSEVRSWSNNKELQTQKTKCLKSALKSN